MNNHQPPHQWEYLAKTLHLGFKRTLIRPNCPFPPDSNGSVFRLKPDQMQDANTWQIPSWCKNAALSGIKKKMLPVNRVAETQWVIKNLMPSPLVTPRWPNLSLLKSLFSFFQYFIGHCKISLKATFFYFVCPSCDTVCESVHSLFPTPPVREQNTISQTDLPLRGSRKGRRDKQWYFCKEIFSIQISPVLSFPIFAHWPLFTVKHSKNGCACRSYVVWEVLESQ